MATKKTKSKATAKKTKEPVDPRAPIAISPATMKSTLAAVEAAIGRLEAPEEPEVGGIVNSMIHLIFAEGLPCGYGQEVMRRIDTEFVDRNEYRVTEAFELEELLSDLELPNAFERCRVAKEAVSAIYNDQNSVSLEFLREAPAAERKGFFARVPEVSRPMSKFLMQVVAYEEVLFSPRSTQRVQARLGFDPKASGVDEFFVKLRELVAPFGHLPLLVGPNTDDGKPILEPELSPLCALTRLGAK